MYTVCASAKKLIGLKSRDHFKHCMQRYFCEILFFTVLGPFFFYFWEKGPSYEFPFSFILNCDCLKQYKFKYKKKRLPL